MAGTIVRKLRISHGALAELLHLPPGAEVASVREDFYGVIEVTVVDPRNRLLGCRVYDKDKKKWIKTAEKGHVRGAGRRLSKNK